MDGQLQLAPDFPVEVIRSARRRKTVGAQLRGGVLRITVPSWVSAREEAHWVDTMTRRFASHRSASAIDLPRRARHLAALYDLPLPVDIRWVSNMAHRWGSCTPATGVVRISDRLAGFPSWVVDYVVVHELAHLRHPDHSAQFHRLEQRYPKAERAIGYLIARSGGGGDTGDDTGLDMGLD
jgi:predicted metal-dependent hydrolase